MLDIFLLIHKLDIWQQILIGPGISFVGILLNHIKFKKQQKTKNVIDIICSFWIILSIGIGIYNYLYIVEVPDLINDTSSYAEARNELEKIGLKIDSEKSDDTDNYYVIEQSAKPGSFVKKGSIIYVELDIDEYNDSNYKEAIREYSLPTMEVGITLSKLVAQIGDEDGKVEAMIGPRIPTSEEFSISLCRKSDENLDKPLTISSDYTIVPRYSKGIDDVVLFNTVPYGSYDIYVNVKGYKENKLSVDIDSGFVSPGMNIFLTPENAGTIAPSRIYFLGTNSDRVSCNEFYIQSSGGDSYYVQDFSNWDYKESALIYTYSGAYVEFHIYDESGTFYVGHATIAAAGEDVYLVLDKLLHRANQISEEEYMRHYTGTGR